MNGIRARSGRTAIGIPLALGSIVVGVIGATTPAARSGAVEKAFAPELAVAWYVTLLIGALLLAASIARPWPGELNLRTHRQIVNRLFCERAGLFIVGWQWTSYAPAAVYSQMGLGGSTAAGLALIVGTYTCLRLFEIRADLADLRCWVTRHLDAATPEHAVEEG